MTLTLPYILPDPYTQADLDALSAFVNGINTNFTHYGTFYDTTNQTAALTTAVYNVAIGTTGSHNGLNLSGVGRITATATGVYRISHGIQFANSDTAAHDVHIWFRINGSDVANSASTYSIPAKHGTVEGHFVANDSHLFGLTAGDYIELWWNTEDVTTYIVSLPIGPAPVYPLAPSVTVDISFAVLP